MQRGPGLQRYVEAVEDRNNLHTGSVSTRVAKTRRPPMMDITGVIAFLKGKPFFIILAMCGHVFFYISFS